MSRSHQEKFVTLYDTAKKCLLIIERLFTGLESSTDKLVEFQGNKQSEEIAIDINIFTMSLVDNFHRFHQIIQAMPLLSKKHPEVKKLECQIEPVKNCRNYLQHIRGDLSDNEPITYPIFGSLSWVTNNINYILLSKQFPNQFSSPAIAFNKLENKYVCKFQLSIGGFELQLDTIYQSIKYFWAWLDEFSYIEPKEVKDYLWGSPTIIKSKIV